MEYAILIAGYIVGFYMAWNIGANDVANSMASAVGAKAITLRQAIFIAGILNLTGAVLLGSHVTDTIRRGIVSTEIMSNPQLALIGALSALLSAALWVSFATWKSLPVSTTHSIVGAMIGFGIMAGGVSVIHWSKLLNIVLSWIISPFFSLLISFFMIKVIIRLVLSSPEAFIKGIKYSPLFIGLTAFIIIQSFLFKTPLGQKLAVGGSKALMIALIAGIFIGFLGKQIINRYLKPSTEDGAEEIFRRIQIATSCYVALAQGANDVANAIGPLALIYFLVTTGSIAETIPVPIHLLFFGGIGITCGISLWGYRVMQTIGTKITTLNNSRGFSVDFAAATTVLVASQMGLPVSTTHAAVGGVLGVGLARGISAVNVSIILHIILYWVLTVPAAALTCMIVFKILQFILL